MFLSLHLIEKSVYFLYAFVDLFIDNMFINFVILSINVYIKMPLKLINIFAIFLKKSK
jgi:hypothetical protein